MPEEDSDGRTGGLKRLDEWTGAAIRRANDNYYCRRNGRISNSVAADTGEPHRCHQEMIDRREPAIVAGADTPSLHYAPCHKGYGNAIPTASVRKS